MEQVAELARKQLVETLEDSSGCLEFDPPTVDSVWSEVEHDNTRDVADSGEVIEIDPPRRLVLSWRNEFKPEMREDGYSRLTYELEQQGDSVKLTVIHESDKPGSKLIEGVSNGWPLILASLKSLLETGESLEATRHWPQGI